MSGNSTPFTFQSSPLPKRRLPRPLKSQFSFQDTSFQPSKKRNFAQSYASDDLQPSRVVSVTISPSLTTQSLDLHKVQGTFDTPSTYVQTAQQEQILQGTPILPERTEIDELAEGQPPSKKRKGLTGTLLSVGLEAALFTTAIGWAAYQLWRDRGKPKEETQVDETKDEEEQEQPVPGPPPPPYHEIQPHPQHRQQRHVSRRRLPSRTTPIDSSSQINFTPSLDPPNDVNNSSWWPSVAGPEPRFEPLQAEDGEEEDDMFKEFGDRLKGLIDAGKQALTQKPTINLTEDELMEGVETYKLPTPVKPKPTPTLSAVVPTVERKERKVPGFAAPTSASTQRGRAGTSHLSSSVGSSEIIRSQSGAFPRLGHRKSVSTLNFGGSYTPNRHGSGRGKSVDLGRSLGSSSVGSIGRIDEVDYGTLHGSFERMKEEVEGRKRKGWWEEDKAE